MVAPGPWQPLLLFRFVIKIVTDTNFGDWTLLCKARGLCRWWEGEDLFCAGAEISLYSSTYVVLEDFFLLFVWVITHCNCKYAKS